MIGAIRQFIRDRRGAIAIIFAASLVPMAMLVGLSIDFSFYAQARAQITLAADAAATHAIRAATETYTAEINQNPPLSAATAIADADQAGETAGAEWFWAQLGQLPTASVTGSNNPNVTVQSNTNLSPNNPAGFTATVAYTGTYPPFFDPLFSSTANWKITGTAGALSTYSYVEILMLLDNSGSMDIGATPADILNLEQHSVCLPSNWTNTGANGMRAYDTSNPTLNINMNTVADYNSSGSATNTSGKCASGYQAPNSPFSPCGFACHTETSGQDLYGVARSNGVRLRLDVVISAAENVISSMEANEQAPDQFSVGVYQFNSDISPLFPTNLNQESGTSTEASANLSAALSAVQAIDYYKNSSYVPPVLPNVLSSCCETNLPTSVSDLVAGAYANGTKFGLPLAPAGSGNTPATPQKDIFIVTDGMEDGPAPGTRANGEMTSVAAEAGQYSPTGPVCQKFKSLGFTVYVLYIDYNSLPNQYYMTRNVTPTPYFYEDYPSLNGQSLTTQDYAEPSAATNNGHAPGPNAISPDEAALQACASSPSDFFVANNAADISTAMNAMLKSALSTTIRITQ
jgi:Flp pilus assembly protein TadG